MPNQITHIAISAKIFDEVFVKFNKKEFFIGTAFPDIRYVALVGRDTTHFDNITLDSVLNAETSFTAGVLFHSLVDKTFNDRVVSNLEKVAPPDDIVGVAKLLADELLYNKVDNWSEIASYFDNIIAEEFSLGFSEEVLLTWHTAIKDILIEAPTDMNRLKFMEELNFSHERIIKANRLLSKIRGDQGLSKILLDFYNNFTL